MFLQDGALFIAIVQLNDAEDGCVEEYFDGHYNQLETPRHAFVTWCCLHLDFLDFFHTLLCGYALSRENSKIALLVINELYHRTVHQIADRRGFRFLLIW